MILKTNDIDEETEIKNKRQEHGKVYDIGLSILRPFFAYIVVMTHCYEHYHYLSNRWKVIYWKTERFFFPVRVFFIMSFYYSHKTLISSNSKRKFKDL